MKNKIEELRLKYVVTDEELKIAKEQKLLSKMYECQDLMANLLDKGTKDEHYILMQELIDRLEKHLENKQDLM